MWPDGSPLASALQSIKIRNDVNITMSSLFLCWQTSKLGCAKTSSMKRSSTRVLNQPDLAQETGSAPQRLVTNPGWLFLLPSDISFSLWTRTRCHLYKYRLVCDNPVGGVGVDGISREAEGQQGTELTVEKFNRIRQHSPDVFSPARDGQMMPSLPSCVP